MSAKPRKFSDFATALKTAYEEEVSGEAFFAALGQHMGGRAAEVLTIFSEIEHVTALAVAPLIRRHDIAHRSRAELVAEGKDEAAGLNSVEWADFLARVVSDYPAYVHEFETLRDSAGSEDRTVLQLLVEHEVAMLDFARLEVAGTPDATAPLRAFLARAAAV
ncbi:MAG: hypothetical protein KDE03_11350 [Rhodobacteraceae bacterium]|nr:hypothetical protein [Paracoccaceae bacterium]